jgi:hypothetical protein
VRQPPRRRRSWRPRRSIYFIDAENIAGSHRPTRLDLRRGCLLLGAAVPASHLDHIVVAAGTQNAVDAGLTWPGAQLLVGHGNDGADVELLEWAARAHLEERFDVVVIASGDFAFVDLAAVLRRKGIPVVVAAWRASCSRQLAATASAVRWLDPIEPLACESAVTIGVVDAA